MLLVSICVLSRTSDIESPIKGLIPVPFSQHPSIDFIALHLEEKSCDMFPHSHWQINVWIFVGNKIITDVFSLSYLK